MTMPKHPRPCADIGCDTIARKRHLCARHYTQRAETKTLPTISKPSESERFWSKVERRSDAECWPWIGKLATTGYGQFRTCEDRLENAHRYIYTRTHGALDPLTLVDHVCRNRACVNPTHMRPATRKQNSENMGGATRASRSGVRGVWFVPKDGRYHVQVTHNGRRHSGKTWKTLEEANAAAVDLRNRLFTHNDVDRVNA